MTTLLQPPATKLQRGILDCHSDGHSWRHQVGRVDPSEAEAGLRPPWGMDSPIGRRSICTSCTSERMRWVTASGEAQNKYRYVDGYLHKKTRLDDEPAPTRQEWRQMMFKTLQDAA